MFCECRPLGSIPPAAGEFSPDDRLQGYGPDNNARSKICGDAGDGREHERVFLKVDLELPVICRT